MPRPPGARAGAAIWIEDETRWSILTSSTRLYESPRRPGGPACVDSSWLVRRKSAVLRPGHPQGLSEKNHPRFQIDHRGPFFLETLAENLLLRDGDRGPLPRRKKGCWCISRPPDIDCPAQTSIGRWSKFFVRCKNSPRWHPAGFSRQNSWFANLKDTEAKVWAVIAPMDRQRRMKGCEKGGEENPFNPAQFTS